MKKYLKVQGKEMPEAIVMDDYSVWIAENITPIEIIGSDEETVYPGYEYDLTQYTKDEYILKTNDDITDLLVQIASVEVEAGNLELESINEAFQGAVKLKIEDGKRLDK